MHKKDILKHEKEINNIKAHFNEEVSEIKAQLNYKLWFGTIEEFNALTTIDTDTIYLIKE